jgi:two-component system cell cycle sensor histidine kinase/response regulator CckA
MEKNKKGKDEIERRRLQEYIFNLEEKQEMAEDLAIEHEQLKHTQEFLNAILSATTHGMCLIKNDDFIWCNRGLTDIFGWEHDELVGRTIEILFPEKDEHDRINEIIYRELSKAGNITFDYDFVHKNGERIACLVTGRPLDESDISRGVIFSFTDFSKRKRAEEALQKAHDKLEERVKERTRELYSINKQLNLELTERKRAEESLRKSEDKYRLLYEESKRAEEVYRSLINSSADAIVIYDMEGIPEYISPSFTMIFGWTMDELEGKRIPFLPESEKATTLKIINDVIENGTPCHGYGTKRFSKDGQLIDVSISASRYSDHEGKPAGMLVVIRDISKRKLLEAKFQQAQKMKAIGTLAGGIAHDFNNLLMGIQGRTSLMLMGIDPFHPFVEHLQGIEEYVKSASDLSKQLLGYARGGKYEVKPANPNEIIKKSSEMFGRTKKEIAIYRKFQVDVWTVEVDRRQIEQVLLNLYVNAWQAMPAGGELYLETRNIMLDEHYMKSYDVEPGNYVKINITDTGVGMYEETRSRAFDPFFTTRDMGRGTGLGLASAYGIVKNHRGYINVYSEQGEGTTFSIYLPASKEKVQEEMKPSEAILKGMETVLLVDDEAMIIDIGKQFLESLGYKVFVATSSEEALETYRENKDRIHLVLLDMIMPGIGGGETYDRMKEINPDIKVLLSSGYSITGEATEILKRGCDGFIQKPFNINGLSNKIREILDSATEDIKQFT